MMMPKNDNRKTGESRTGCACRLCGNHTASAAEECRSCPLSRGGCTGNTTQLRGWMRRLQMVDFALQELILYLDMYPDCRRALHKYHTLRAEREQLVKMLQAGGVPICAIGNAKD